jgi:catechol 2,3-dioxygenase-like lactoylglutathione lyase family enzyme
MLSRHTPVPTLPAKDLSAARGFYEGTLGLPASREDMEGGVTYLCGGGQLFVYESTFAGTNQATAVSFDVPNTEFDDEVAELRGKGIEFVTFAADGLEWNDGVATIGGRARSVWFTDPDGNILNISTDEL